MSPEDGATLATLCNHIGNFPLFVGQENMGSNLFTICLAQVIPSDDLPKQTQNSFDIIIALPGNAFIQKIGENAQRITKLQSQNPQQTAEDFGVWKELFTIDPHMTTANLIMASTACFAQMGQVYQLYSVNNMLGNEDSQIYMVPLNYDNYEFTKRFIQLYGQNDETMKNTRLNHWSICNSLKKFQEAYQQFMILEGEFGFGLPSVDNPDHFSTIHHFIETFSQHPNVKPEHFAALEAYLLGKGNSSVTMETYNTGYSLLARLYANKKMHQKLVNLYEQQREHFIISWDHLQQGGIITGIFNACLDLENFDVALDVLDRMEQNLNQYFIDSSSPKIGEHESIEKKRQKISIKRSIVDFAKGNKGAALERVYPIASTLSVSDTQREILNNASVQLVISLMEGKTEDVIQTLEKMPHSDPTILFGLIYLKDKYYPSSAKEIDGLKEQYFNKFSAFYEDDMVNKFSYETAVLNILTKSNRVIYSTMGA